ncbi:MAG: hypothetical protein ACRCX2_18020 [Paraclostridium sp.]
MDCRIILEVAKPLYSEDDKKAGSSWSHIQRVLNDLLSYAYDFDLDSDTTDILFIAMSFHDCIKDSKDNHHELSANKFRTLVRRKVFLNGTKESFKTQRFCEDNLDIIYDCIWEHRSSMMKNKKSELGRISSLVDFGYPFNIEKAMKKSIKRAIKKKEKDTFEGILKSAHKHFTKKWLWDETNSDITTRCRRKLTKTYNKMVMVKFLAEFLDKNKTIVI